MPALKVLVLEDHPLPRAVMVHQLQRCGVAHVVEAQEGAQAIALLQACGGVDIAICDLQMAGMDGLAFLHHISEETLVRAIVISSEVDITLRNAVGTMVGMWGFTFLGDLGKPTRLEQLETLLERYASHATRGLEVPGESTILPPRHEVLRALHQFEFEAYFQPKISLPYRRLSGAEVLARWRHPTLGVLGPSAFLSMLEELGELDTLFWQLLEQGLALQQIHPGLGLAFNVHTSQLASPEFARRIACKLKEYGVPANLLTLEITESGALAVTPDALAVLLRLRLMGCVLAMDDFGAGYSSLGRLCELPFNQIKLDGAFLQDLHRDSRGYAVIRSAVGLAHALDLSLVIEGVETPEQLTYLHALGCREVQGFLFGRPVCASRFSKQLPSLKAGKNAHVEQ